MDFIDSFVLPPASKEHLLIVKYILVVLFTVYFSYAGMLLGKTLYSLIFNISDKRKENKIYARFSRDLMNSLLMDRKLIVMLGILPLIAIGFASFQLLYLSHSIVPVLIIYSIVISMMGFLCLYLYKITFPAREKEYYTHIFSGFIGISLFFVAHFAFIASTGYLMNWKVIGDIENPFKILFSLNILIRYFLMLLASMCISGGGILFFFLDWAGGVRDMEQDYKDLVIKIGINFTRLFMFLLIIFLFFYLFTLPEGARTIGVTGPTGLILLSSFGIYVMMYKYELKFELAILLGFVLIFFSMAMNDYYNRETAMESHNEFLTGIINKMEEERTGIAVALADGKVVFKNICASCHQYELKLEGPPFSTVLPDYKNKFDELKAFIRNPVKIDPNYPVMPKPPINENELTAVTEYLLTDYWKEHTGETLYEKKKESEDESNKDNDRNDNKIKDDKKDDDKR